MRDGDLNNSKISGVGDNNTNTFNDNSINDNSKHITIIKPNVQQIKYKNPDTFRPKLKGREGDNVTGYGFIVKKYNEKYYTIINLVDEEGMYMADHTQMDLKENVFNYKIEPWIQLIKFTGKVNKYTRSNGTQDYEIDLVRRPSLYDGDLFNPDAEDNLIKKYSREVDIEKITKFTEEDATERKIQDLIIVLSKEINVITSFDYGKNVLVDFIMNTFFLNRATYDLYDGNIRSISCSNYGLMDLSYILSAVLYDLETSDKINLGDLFNKIVNWCNILQKVSSYNKGCDLTFKKYCKKHLYIETEEQLKEAWSTLLYRKRNFGDDVTGGFTLEDILSTAFQVLNNYIERID